MDDVQYINTYTQHYKMPEVKRVSVELRYALFLFLLLLFPLALLLFALSPLLRFLALHLLLHLAQSLLHAATRTRRPQTVST